MFELRHLAAIDAVVTEGTFRRAAEVLGYTQSTLSQQIAGLERSVAGAVFERPGGARRVRLTPLGGVVLEQARLLLGRDAAARETIERFRAGAGRIDVGTFQTVTHVLLPQVVRRLRDEQPQCDIRLFEEETESPRLDGLDVVFFDGLGPREADRVEVLRDEHVVVARRDDFRGPTVGLAQLHGRPMVALPAICDQRRVEAAFAEAGVAPRIVFRTADNQGVAAMVRAGLGCAVMPLLAVSAHRTDPALSLLPIEPALPPRIVYALTEGTSSPIARRFVELAVEIGAGLG
jgi:DNA-binding transcriptional LysR family regulator